MNAFCFISNRKCDDVSPIRVADFSPIACPNVPERVEGRQNRSYLVMLEVRGVQWYVTVRRWC